MDQLQLGRTWRLYDRNRGTLGDPNPLTAYTLIGVTSLWLRELLVEIDAVAVV